MRAIRNRRPSLLVIAHAARTLPRTLQAVACSDETLAELDVRLAYNDLFAEATPMSHGGCRLITTPPAT